MTNLKQFLKPDWRKIVIFLIFFITLFYYFDGKYPIDYMYIAMGGLLDGALIGLGYGYNWFYFALDILFWGAVAYFFSCLIIWIYGNLRKRK